MSASPDSTLDPQQVIADLKRQLAESNAERDEALAREREALEQQTATAEVLGVINSSPGDLAPVFDAILHKAVVLCEAAFGVLLTYEAEQFHAVALHNVPQRFAELMREPFRSRGPESATGRLALGENVVLFADIAAHPAYAPETPGHKFVQSSGARSHLAVALRKDGVLHGAVIIYRTEVRPFTDKQIALLQNFAAQAVIAMENARLITETREALEQQTATTEVLQVINSSPGDLAPVFDAMLEKATRLCEATYGHLYTYDGQRYHPVAVHGEARFVEWRLQRGPIEIPVARMEWQPVGTSGAPLERLVAGERVVVIDDAPSTEAYRASAGFRALVDASGIRSGVTVALRNDGALLGAITVYRQEVRPFSEREVALLENFAAQAVIAMENARLINETREALEQQTATAEVLGVINASPGDLGPVFDAILEKAHNLCGVTYGSLQLYDGETLRAVATRGYPEPLEKIIREPYTPVRGGPLQTLIEGGPLTQIRDITEYDTQAPNPRRRVAAELGIRTLLFLPLRKDNLLLGIISADRTEARLFSDRETALLENFAAQAVIAMETARLITETREALEQQTAVAEVLGVINSSPGDLKAVFGALLERAMRLCDANVGTLWTYDGEAFLAEAMQGARADHARWATNQTRRGGPGSISGQLIGGENVIHIPDAADTDAYRAGDPVRREMVDVNEARTLLAVALRKDDRLLGYIIIYRREVRPFTDKQIALLQNFAAQAVIAMENARLITETREALDQQTATAEVLGVINSSPGDVAPVFDAILEKAHSLCGSAFGSLQLYDNGKFRAVAVRGMPDSLGELLRQPVDPLPGAPPTRLLGGERIVQVADIALYAEQQPDDPRTQVSTEHGLRTALFVPLRRDADLLGYITAFRQEVRPFTDKQIALLENFAAQAVIAMENARLITETREALEQQTATAEVLQVINASPGDLAPVFDAMVERAAELCEADEAAVRTFDGEVLTLAATHGPPGVFEELMQLGPSHPDGLYAGIAKGDAVTHFVDVRDTEAFHANERARERLILRGIRSWLAVALRKEGALLGVINVHRREVRPFTDKQIALLQNFAAQAVIAMENARLITETREALDQQTATAEVLGVINSSPGDLAPVFEAMLERAKRLCEGDFGTLWTFDGDRFHVGAVHGEPRFRDLVRQRGSIRPDRDASPLGRILAGERVVRFADVPGEEGYQTSTGFREMSEASGVRSAIWVALHKDDALLGTITVYRQEVRPFTDKQIALLQNFAAQAVIAMENARLITETREALDQQTATAEVLGVINSSPGDLAPVFDAMLEKAMHLCEAAFGLLALFDGGTYRTVATRNLPEAFAAFLQGPQPISPNGSMARITRGESLVQIVDVTTDEGRRAMVIDGGARTTIWVALRKDGAALGCFNIYRQEVRPFTDKQIVLLQNFAAQAVIAMENARLITETREALEQQTATAEVLQVINSSPGDLTPVFEAILEKAHTLCGAAFGGLLIYDGDRFKAVALHNVPPAFAEIARQPFPPTRNNPVQRLLEGAPLVHIADLKEIVDADPDEPMPRAGVELGGIRTLLMVPLCKDKAFLGIITAYRQEVRPFTDKQIALLQNFAAQAVIAMENARLLGELHQRTEEVGELNRDLEARVAEQVDELGRVGRLKRFLAPQLAELIVSQGDEKILESHRREIVVVFCDLRGYTAFTETAEPEEVLDFLREYHGALGPLVSQFEGTLDQFSGDGIMVFFNDPVPCPDPAERAVKMAIAMRGAARDLITAWSRHGCELGFGVGIAQGYATLGQIGFSERSGYTAIGTVCNLAARLCAEAKDGQILVSSRIAEAVEAVARLEDLGNLDLKGLRRPVAAFNVAQSTSPAEARPNLNVVARDTGA